jgi:hypothetical protein
LFVLSRSERLLQRQAQQDGVVRVAHDGVVSVRHEIVGRDHIGDHARRDFSHRTRQVLVIHRVDRDL